MAENDAYQPVVEANTSATGQSEEIAAPTDPAGQAVSEPTFESITAGVDERSTIPPVEPVDAVVTDQVSAEQGQVSSSFVGAVAPDAQGGAAVSEASNGSNGGSSFWKSKKVWWIGGGITVLLLLAAVTASWYFWLGGKAVLSLEVSPTPTPAPTVAASATPTPSVTATPNAGLLSPLNLTTVEPRVLIKRSDAIYSVNYEGKDERLMADLAGGAMVGDSRKCAFYVKDSNVFRMAIDGTQVSQITSFDPTLFERPANGGTSDVGPELGIQLMWVNMDCSRAIAKVTTNDGASVDYYATSAKSGVAPVGNISGSDMLVSSVGDQPVYEKVNKLYKVDTSGIASELFKTEFSRSAYAPTYFINSTGRVIYISGDTDTSQVVELDTSNGQIKEITSKGSTREFEELSVSPDFATVMYGQTQASGLMKFFTYNRASGQAEALKQADSNGRVAIWLDNDTYVFDEQRKVADGTHEDYLWKCSVSKNSCGDFAAKATVVAER